MIHANNKTMSFKQVPHIPLHVIEKKYMYLYILIDI